MHHYPSLPVAMRRRANSSAELYDSDDGEHGYCSPFMNDTASHHLDFRSYPGGLDSSPSPSTFRGTAQMSHSNTSVGTGNGPTRGYPPYSSRGNDSPVWASQEFAGENFGSEINQLDRRSAGHRMHGSQHWVKKHVLPVNSDGPFLSGPHSTQIPVDPRPSSEVNPVHRPGIRLRPVSDLPDRYRDVFKFGVFNAIQSTCMDKVLHSQENLIISCIYQQSLSVYPTYSGLAPTGSGKTVLFELAIIRMLTQATSKPQSVKCVYVAPTKALCTEKYREWTTKFGGLGIKSCELTGDTHLFGMDIWGEAKNTQIIVTTAEKWDSITRNWDEHARILCKIKLFLVDEVHILNESRGSTLEVIISRMKGRGSAIRFLLVSATVPNIEDIANWIGNNDGSRPATVFQFGEEFRPCRLEKFVYGIPRPKGQNDFAYAHTLDRRLFGFLQRHSQDKPILVFCPTRKGTVETAKQLTIDYEEAMKARNSLPWSLPTRIDANFHDKDLATLTTRGVAVHHAGLNLDDRKMVEDLYLQKTLRVLVATSTLAVGVNLPAHIVVIKGVKLYQNGETKEYSDLEVLQMMGRAGRPQFDDEGIAIILCESELQSKYRALVQGTTTIESNLHRNLVEHLNSEICLGAITDCKNAKDWLCRSFFFCRIQKNPQHYDIGKVENETWQEKIDSIVMEAIYILRDTQLIAYNEKDGMLCSTEYGDIMSKCYVRQTTMRLILELPSSANLRQILEMMSSTEELANVKLRSGERQLYEKIRQHNDIRFPIRKISTAKDKTFLLVQAILAGLPLSSPEFKVSDSQPYLEAISIFRHLSRIAAAIAEVAVVKRCGAQVKYALELARCLHAKAWEDHPLVLRQIEHIGDKSTKVLAENGINSIQKLMQTSSFRIEELLNRRPPFGSEVLAAAREFPRYTLSMKEIRSMPSAGNKPVEVKLLVECGLILDTTAPQKTRELKRIGTEKTTLLTLTSDLAFIDFRRTFTKTLVNKKVFTVTAHLTKPSQAINVYISSDTFAGVTVTATYRPAIAPSKYPMIDTRPLTSIEFDLQGLEDVPEFWDVDISDDEGACAVPVKDLTTKSCSKDTSSSKEPTAHKQHGCSNAHIELPKERPYKKRPDGKYECNHPCKDKFKCRHYCCKEGLPEPPRSQKKKHAEQLETLTNQRSIKTHGLFTKRNSRRKGVDQVTHTDHPRPENCPSDHEGVNCTDLDQRNNSSTLKKTLTHAGSSKGRKRTKPLPNFDLELTSLRSGLGPFVSSKAPARDDDELQTISEILRRDRSRTPESNYSNSEIDSLIRQMPLDMCRPETPCHDTGWYEERRSKRQRLSIPSPTMVNTFPHESGHPGSPSHVLEEKVTMPTFTPIHKPGITPLFMSSPPNMERVQHPEDNCLSPSLLPDRTTPYDEFFGADDPCFDIFPVSTSQTLAGNFQDAASRDKTPADTKYTSTGLFNSEKLQASRSSGFMGESITKPKTPFQHQGWTDSDPQDSPSLGLSAIQQPTFDVQPVGANACCSPAKNGNSMWEDALVEFDSWLASGAVDIVTE